MTIARSVEDYLSKQHIPYDTLDHTRTQSSRDSAWASHIPGRQMAKAVVLRDKIEGHYLMALVPASRMLDIGMLQRESGRELEMVEEDELMGLFPDCEIGAVPGFGSAYNMSVIWDDSLGSEADVYFEGGDHRQLVHLDHDQFMSMYSKMPHGQISRYTTGSRDFRTSEYS